MKRIGIVILSMLMAISLTACTIYTEEDVDDARQSGYDDGYDEGYEIGYDEGYDVGYDEGHSEAEYDNGENDLSGYLGPYPGTSNNYLTTDTAPTGTVWVTPHGEKYHEGWCQYVSGRHDLTYFNSADDAMNAGYSPCSVCH